jgi:uncharacterized membrane protein SpoIIM required for sporulation
MTGAEAAAWRRTWPPARTAVLLWIVVAVVVWNGLYDLRISLGVRDYLMHAALHDAGRGPELSMTETMRQTVVEAVKVATFWAAFVLAAGLATVLLLTPRRSSA